MQKSPAYTLLIFLFLLRKGLDRKFAFRTGCDRMSEFSGYDKNGRFVMIMRQKFADPDHFSVHTIYKTLLMLFTIAMEDNRQAYCRGYVILSDQVPELQQRSSKIFEERSLRTLLSVGNLYQLSTTLSLEPVSINHYTRPGSMIQYQVADRKLISYTMPCKLAYRLPQK